MDKGGNRGERRRLRKDKEIKKKREDEERRGESKGGEEDEANLHLEASQTSTRTSRVHPLENS